jgi:hypothetical protein
MSASDVVSAAGQTVLRDTKDDCGHGGHHSYDHGCQPRSRGCDDHDGEFHILSGQQRESIQIGDGGRFNDAFSGRILKSVADADVRAADRSQAATIAILKEASDSKAALLREVMENRVSAAKDTLETKYALAKENLETRVDVLRAIAESRMDCEKSKCAIEEKICALKEKVADSLRDLKQDLAEDRRDKDRFDAIRREIRDTCGHRREGGHGNGH